MPCVFVWPLRPKWTLGFEAPHLRVFHEFWIEICAKPWFHLAFEHKYQKHNETYAILTKHAKTQELHNVAPANSEAFGGIRRTRLKYEKPSHTASKHNETKQNMTSLHTLNSLKIKCKWSPMTQTSACKAEGPWPGNPNSEAFGGALWHVRKHMFLLLLFFYKKLYYTDFDQQCRNNIKNKSKLQ